MTITRLEALKLNNPLYSQNTDEEILTQRYNDYYKDSGVDFSTYKNKMNEEVDYESNVISSLEKSNQQAISSDNANEYLNVIYETNNIVDNQEKIGFIEGLQRAEWKNIIPVFSAVKEGYNLYKIKKIAENLELGLEVNDKDFKYFADYVAKQQEEAARGRNIGGHIAGAIPDTIGFTLEFALSGGIATAIKTASKKAIKKAVKKTITSKIKDVAIRGAEITAIHSILGGAYREYNTRMLNNSLTITDKGQAFFNSSNEKPATTLLKSLLSVYIADTTELMGETFISPLLNGISGSIAKTQVGKALNKIAKPFNNLIKQTFKTTPVNALRQFGWDGILEEIGEERLEGLLRYAFNIDNQGYSWESFKEQEGLNFDSMMVELGIIGIQGSVSHTGARLFDKLTNNGIERNEAINLINSLTETQKDDALRNLNEQENKIDNEKFNNDIETIKQQAINNGLNEQEVNNSLELFKAQVEGYASNTGINKVDLLNKLKTEINVVDSLAQQGNEVFNQSLDIARQNEELDAKFPEYTENTININGIEKSVFNSNGDRIAKSKEALENFYKWFGDSKVVNEKGEPLVVYHSTNAEFDTFSKRKQKGGVFAKGFYFSKIKERTTPYGIKTLSTYLKMKNPFIIENGDGLSSAIANQLEITKKEIAKKYGHDRYYENFPTDTAYRNFLQDKGYDGIVSEATQEIVVFEPNQIKSVENKGQFSLNNNNIYYQNKNTKKGSIEFLGDKSIINLVKGNYDQSTLTHELSHNFLKLVELSKDTNEFTKAKWDEIQKVFKDESETKGSYYSTQEKFARSWESYLRRGIAPTNKLKAIFEEFREWLTNIYQSIKDLNINLSPDAIKFFDSILISNETFNNENFQQAYEDLQNEINNRREVLYQEGKTEQEVENTIEKEFKDRLAKIEEEMQSLNYREYNVDEYLKKLDEYKKSQGILSSVGNIYNNLTDFLNETIISENQNIREISEKIYMKYLNMDFAINQDLKRYSDILENFNKNVLDLKKNNSKDYDEFSIAWYNNNMEEIEKISTKYGFFEEFKNVRTILEELYDRQVEVGVDIGYRKNYLPTRIKANEFEKVKNVIAEKYGSDILSELEKVATGKGYLLNSPEGISLLSNYLRGYTPRGITLSPSNFTKQRTLERSKDFFPFYQSFEKSLADYISQTTRNINEREFFGKSTAEQQKELTKLKRKETQLTKTTDENKRKKLIEEISELRKNIENTNINLESSIGKVIAEELPNISVKDADKLKDFLLSLFKKEPTGKLTQATNTLSGIYVLPNPKSALKQLTELSASIRDFGLNKTITSLFSKNLVNMKDLGLDVDINEPSKLQNLYSKALKSVGFDKADMIGKNTYLNSAFLDTQEKIRNNDKKTINNLEMMFEDKAEEVKEKFLQGKATDYDVMSYLFYLINDTQPLSSGSKTKFFNDHPNFRFMYNLKSYLIQQISFIKNKVINEAKQGNIATATKNLVNLQLSLWFTGVPISMIADILFGDDDDRTLWEKLPDFMIDNLMLNNILNRFNLLKIISGNIGDFVLGFTLPPFFTQTLNYLGQDFVNIVKIINGEKESKLINKNSTIKQFKNLVEKLD